MLNDVYGSSGDVSLEASGLVAVETGRTPSPPLSYSEENVIMSTLKFNENHMATLTFAYWLVSMLQKMTS